MITVSNINSVRSQTMSDSRYINEMIRIKSSIQSLIIPQLTLEEKNSIRLSTLNHNVIAKLVNLGKLEYANNPLRSDTLAFCIAMAIGTIIKEYDWGLNYVMQDGIIAIANGVTNTTPFNLNQNSSADRIYSIGKPEYKNFFIQDIQNSVDNIYNAGPQELSELCVMYACDICLEFKNKSGGILPSDWIKHIAAQTCDVFIENYSPAYNQSCWDSCFPRIYSEMQNPYQIQQKVNMYYNR